MNPGDIREEYHSSKLVGRMKKMLVQFYDTQRKKGNT